jgi:hypothetical protein
MPGSDLHSRALVGSAPSAQDLLVGAGIGSILGRLIVHWSEQRREGELPAHRVRQIEITWIAVGVTIRFMLGVTLG